VCLKYFSSLGVPNCAAYYRYRGCYRMNSCDNGVNLLLYLDNELSDQELKTFCAQLQNCPTCKVGLEEERHSPPFCTISSAVRGCGMESAGRLHHPESSASHPANLAARSHADGRYSRRLSRAQRRRRARNEKLVALGLQYLDVMTAMWKILEHPPDSPPCPAKDMGEDQSFRWGGRQGTGSIQLSAAGRLR